VSKSSVVSMERAESPRDALTEVLRRGSRLLLREALEAEVASLLAEYRDETTGDGRRRLVRSGYLPEREIQTGIGGVPVKVPRVRDRAGELVFRSKVAPPYLRRAKSVEELLPWLYLRGVSTGDFSDALEALVGPDAPGLSAPTISRLKKTWGEEYSTWRTRDLSSKRYVYVWADGIHAKARLDDAKLCLLVLMGATEDGTKELIAVEDGYRESEASWLELLRSLEARGLTVEPKLAIGDGALGFWKALAQVWSNTQTQRCWVHKTGNVLNKLPKAIQPKAKQALHQIWMAETRDAAEKAFDAFLVTYETKHPKATRCLANDRVALLTFYDFPAEHWPHLRTTNPIESTFATVRLRTAKTRGCLSRETMLSMVFKLCQSAEKRWRRLQGYKRIAEVIRGVQFVDGEPQERIAA
jgi:putative transposase